VYAGIHLYLHLPAIHAYAYSDCYSHSDWDCNTDAQAKPHSETSHDTEAAPESTAKAEHVRVG